MKEGEGWADSLSAACMLWIICVAHMDEYLGYDCSSFPILLITRGILTTFTFLSGYYMSKKDLSAKAMPWSVGLFITEVAAMKNDTLKKLKAMRLPAFAEGAMSFHERPMLLVDAEL